MKRMLVFMALVASLLSAVTSCSMPVTASPDGAKATVRILEPKDALSLIEKNKGNEQFTILDVRTPGEFQEGHIEGALNVDFNSPLFKNKLDRLDRKKTYLVYCRTGRRSSAAVKTMGELGFADIYRISGDIVKWRSLGLPLVK